MKTYPSITQTVYLLLSLLLLAIVIRIISIIFLDGIVNDSLLDLFSTLIINGTIFTLAYSLKKKRDKQFSIPFRPINRKIYLWITFISPFYFFFVLGIVMFISTLLPYFITKANPRNYSIDVFTLTNLIFMVPIFEELIFRGIILDSFLHRYSSFKAILLSTLCFASLHFGPQIASAIFFGLISGYLYYYTKSLYPSIILHGLNNLYIYIFLTSKSKDINQTNADTIQPIKELISTTSIWWWINTVLLIFILYHLFHKLKKDKSESSSGFHKSVPHSNTCTEEMCDFLKETKN